MFRFSADQRHALRHGLQDFGKLTLAVMFLSSSLGLMQVKSAPSHPARGILHKPACHATDFKPTEFNPLADEAKARL